MTRQYQLMLANLGLHKNPSLADASPSQSDHRALYAHVMEDPNPPKEPAE